MSNLANFVNEGVRKTLIKLERIILKHILLQTQSTHTHTHTHTHTYTHTSWPWIIIHYLNAVSIQYLVVS